MKRRYTEVLKRLRPGSYFICYQYDKNRIKWISGPDQTLPPNDEMEAEYQNLLKEEEDAIKDKEETKKKIVLLPEIASLKEVIDVINAMVKIWK